MAAYHTDFAIHLCDNERIREGLRCVIYSTCSHMLIIMAETLHDAHDGIVHAGIRCHSGGGAVWAAVLPSSTS